MSTVPCRLPETWYLTEIVERTFGAVLCVKQDGSRSDRRSMWRTSWLLETWMITKLTSYGLAVMNAALIVFVIYMLYFASRGARYTAADGELDRQASQSRDAALVVRIEAIERRMAAGNE